MKTRLRQFFALLLLVSAEAPAQDVRPAPPPSPAAWSVALLPPDQLDQLLGPIALYPDALIALMLPASTSASEIVLAARYLQTERDGFQLEAQPWDDSVRALAHYPDTIRWMDENLAWTKQLGEVFLTQPDDVMSAIQRLRSRALAAGTLFSTAQQQVVVEGALISILPAQPNVIYAPYYNPQIVYFSRVGYSSFDEPFLSFGTGFSSGWWLAYHLDWGQRRIWVVDRHARERHWQEHRDWRPGLPPSPGRPGYVGNPPWQTWRPSPDRPHPPRPADAPPRNRSVVVVQPAPYSGAPRFSNPPASSPTPRPEPRPRLAPAEAPARDVANSRFRDGSIAPPVTIVAQPTSVPAEPTAKNPSPRAGPSGRVAPSPTPTPPMSPAGTATTPAGQMLPSIPTPTRTSETRSDQPSRSRPARDDRTTPPEQRTSAEPRSRATPAPTPPAPVATTPPPANATPATPPAPARSAPPAATTEDRRNRKPDEQPK